MHRYAAQRVVGHERDRAALRVETLYEVEVALHVVVVELAAHDVIVVEVFRKVVRLRIPLHNVEILLSRNLHYCRVSHAHYNWRALQLGVVEREEHRRRLQTQQHDARRTVAVLVILP